MKRDDLIKEARLSGATWQAALIVYALIVGAMAFSAMAIL